MKIIGSIFSTLVILFISIFLRAFVVVKLWSWFVVTTFMAVPLNFAQALGLITLFNFVVSAANVQKKDSINTNDDEYWEFMFLFIEGLSQALIVLGIGWIIFQFI